MSAPPILGVLIDLSGTVHIGGEAIPGAAQSIQRLRRAGLRVRFLTNTSNKCLASLLAELQKVGINLDDDKDEILTSVLATKKYLMRHNLHPFCLMEDTSDLEGISLSPPHDCVVVGLAPSKFQYSELNKAFRILLNHPKLVAVHRANYLRDVDGELSLGPGGFVSALETTANCQAVVMGKPSKDFFESSLWSDIPPEQTCMIGDDILQDIIGAIEAGIQTTILVRTGKYRQGDEDTGPRSPTKVCNSIVEAVDFILETSFPTTTTVT